ncbi:MAG TPA: hypothetical protein VF240_21840 [Pyrinomonadaceae bacterium]
MATKKASRAAKGGAAATAKGGAAARKGGAGKKSVSAQARSSSKKRPASKKSPPARGGSGAVVAPVSLAGFVEAGAPPETGGRVSITVRTPQGLNLELRADRKQFQRAAMQWSYAVRNRRRWAERESSRNEQAQRSLQQLQEWGVKETQLASLAEAEMVEVSVPFKSEESSWEARIFPWEYLLTAATRELRQGRPMTVLRHLDRRSGAAAPAAASPPKSLLFVESAPENLREAFTFASERELVKENLGLTAHELIDPTAETLRAEVGRQKPHVVHLAGVDNHQATQLITSLKTVEAPPDGYVMAGSVDMVDAERLAGIVNAASRKPALVSCNFYNSATRVGSLIVAGGADAAIGFQDEFNDALTEFFFTNFYHLWRLSNWNTAEAFRLTCQMLRKQGGLHGAGVVLWSARSLVAPQQPGATLRRGARRVPAPTAAGDREMVKQVEEAKEVEITLKSVGGSAARLFKEIKVVPFKSLNYSMLHNDRDLFETFLIKKRKTGTVRIKVEVILYAGPMTFPYTTTVPMKEWVLDLRKHIRVPLIYSTGPAISESVHTSLYVKVSWEGQELYNDTHRVTLLPLDEWRDDDTDRVWLPSFVLPRDRAVNRVVDAGQRYLWALADDSGAGFDGYQSVVEERDRVTKEVTFDTDGVDLQVQALWAALAFEMNLGYINPPPSYNLSAQRVRTPSEIIDGHRGTCIDLALLMATCCEYIEVYPVIFLLQGHAFPGYWRSDVYHQSFITEMANAPVIGDDMASPQPQGPNAPVQREAWYLDKDFYEEVVQLVHDRKLVPIESTMIARRGSFGDAVDAGIKNLRSKRQFHSLLDVRLARDNRVTPIPLKGGRPE